MKSKFFFYILTAFALFLSVSSCKKDKLLTDAGATLQFSVDTVQFDTVFASVGSATQVFVVRNTYSQPLVISSLYLGSGASSYFRLNVNGVPGKSFTNVEIGANDSIWIFAEVTIDPNNATTPFIISDAIIFNTNSNQQHLDLVAYGQNAHFFPSSNCGEQKSQCTPLFKLKDCAGASHSLHWTNDKPYVIYGYAILDAGYTLTIDAGVRIHFHNNSGIIVTNTAKIIVNGTLTDPVTFEGDRLGDQFKDIPGQWDRIWLSTISAIDLTQCNPIPITTGAGPNGNVFNHAIIKNGFVGIQSDSVPSSPDTIAATLNNTIIKNSASTALYGNGSSIQANNCVFANCGEYLSYLLYGGNYRFLHCTFANYWNNTNRSTPSFWLNNYYTAIRPLTAYFGNCIIYGSQDSEFKLDTVTATGAGYFNFILDHCLYKMDLETYNGSANHYLNSIRNVEPHFKDIDNNIYELDSSSAGSSPAVHTGDPAILLLNPTVLATDIKGLPRPMPGGTNPDMGAYENQDH